MRRVVVIVAMFVGLGSLVARSGVYDQTNCPACRGTGRVLPGTADCGSQDQRMVMMRRRSAHYQHCYTSTECPHCNSGRVGKTDATQIPHGAYVVRDSKGRNASVLEPPAR